MNECSEPKVPCFGYRSLDGHSDRMSVQVLPNRLSAAMGVRLMASARVPDGAQRQDFLYAIAGAPESVDLPEGRAFQTCLLEQALSDLRDSENVVKLHGPTNATLNLTRCVRAGNIEGMDGFILVCVGLPGRQLLTTTLESAESARGAPNPLIEGLTAHVWHPAALCKFINVGLGYKASQPDELARSIKTDLSGFLRCEGGKQACVQQCANVALIRVASEMTTASATVAEAYLPVFIDQLVFQCGDLFWWGPSPLRGHPHAHQISLRCIGDPSVVLTSVTRERDEPHHVLLRPFRDEETARSRSCLHAVFIAMPSVFVSSRDDHDLDQAIEVSLDAGLELGTVVYVDDAAPDNPTLAAVDAEPQGQALRAVFDHCSIFSVVSEGVTLFGPAWGELTEEALEFREHVLSASPELVSFHGVLGRELMAGSEAALALATDVLNRWTKAASSKTSAHAKLRFEPNLIAQHVFLDVTLQTCDTTPLWFESGHPTTGETIRRLIRQFEPANRHMNPRGVLGTPRSDFVIPHIHLGDLGVVGRVVLDPLPSLITQASSKNPFDWVHTPPSATTIFSLHDGQADPVTSKEVIHADLKKNFPTGEFSKNMRSWVNMLTHMPHSLVFVNKSTGQRASWRCAPETTIIFVDACTGELLRPLCPTGAAGVKERVHLFAASAPPPKAEHKCTALQGSLSNRFATELLCRFLAWPQSEQHGHRVWARVVGRALEGVSHLESDQTGVVLRSEDYLIKSASNALDTERGISHTSPWPFCFFAWEEKTYSWWIDVGQLDPAGSTSFFPFTLLDEQFAPARRHKCLGTPAEGQSFRLNPLTVTDGLHIPAKAAQEDRLAVLGVSAFSFQWAKLDAALCARMVVSRAHSAFQTIFSASKPKNAIAACVPPKQSAKYVTICPDTQILLQDSAHYHAAQREMPPQPDFVSIDDPHPIIRHEPEVPIPEISGDWMDGEDATAAGAAEEGSYENHRLGLESWDRLAFNNRAPAALKAVLALEAESWSLPVSVYTLSAMHTPSAPYLAVLSYAGFMDEGEQEWEFLEALASGCSLSHDETLAALDDVCEHGVLCRAGGKVYMTSNSGEAILLWLASFQAKAWTRLCARLGVSVSKKEAQALRSSD